jgi:hypothetical protein
MKKTRKKDKIWAKTNTKSIILTVSEISAVICTNIWNRTAKKLIHTNFTKKEATIYKLFLRYALLKLIK